MQLISNLINKSISIDTIKSRYLDYKILINFCIEQTIIQSNKNIILFQLESRFVLVNSTKKLRIVLNRFAINKSTIFKFKVVSRNIESNKFTFKSNILILLIEDIELDFDSRTVSHTGTIQLPLRLS